MGQLSGGYEHHDWQPGDIISEYLLDNMQNAVKNIRDFIGLTELNNYSTITDAIAALIQKTDEIPALTSSINSISESVGTNSNGTSLAGRISAIEEKIGNETLVETYSSIIAGLNALSGIDVNNMVAQLQTQYEGTIMPEINATITSAQQEFSQSIAQVESSVSSALNDIQNASSNLIIAIYGETNGTPNEIDNEGHASLKEWVESEFDATASNISSSIIPINDTIDTLNSHIGNALGSGYYDNGWVNPMPDSIDSRINAINDTIGGNGGTSLVSQIAQLNDAIFGSGETSSGEETLSLLEKIEGMTGRSLELESNETISSGEYSNSIMSHIRTIEGVLGLNGQISGGESDLLSTISEISSSIYGNEEPYDLGDGYNLAKVLDDLYGELVENVMTGEEERAANPLINTLKNLPTSFSNLSTRVGSIEQHNTQIDATLTGITSGWSSIIENAYTDADVFVLPEDTKTYLRLSRNNNSNPTTLQEMAADLDNTYLQLPEGGGGGGAVVSGTASITRITDTSVQILTGDDCNIVYRLEARDSNNDLVGNGAATWYVGGVQVATSTALNITSENAELTNTFNIAPYLSIGQNNITLQISINTGGEYNNIVRKTWTVNVINFSLVWNYNEETIFNEDVITLEWIPYGANINKTTYMVIDDGEPTAISTTVQSGITQVYAFNHNLAHGAHKVELYLTATINGNSETTEPQVHEIIVVRPSNTTTIISSSFTQTSMEQYDTVAIPIMIYTPNATLTNNVILAADGVTISTWDNVDRTLHYWNYSPTSTGEKVLTITVGSVTKTITITVISISIDNEEVSGYDFKLKASEIVSNADLQSNNLLTFSNNFDWINGGIKSEKDENNNIQQYICVKAGTTMTINKQLFNTELTNGFNTKVIMKTANCGDYDAKILDCYSTTNDENIGLELFAHSAVLSSSARKITTQYSENSYIELEFEVYESNATPRYMMCWVDGVMSIVRVCDNTDHFGQTDVKNIVIGSIDCDVYIYLIKTYYKKLSINEHIVNFIADAPNATTMKARYNRNDILGDDNEIDYEKLYDAAPDCRIWLYDIPRMTTGKKDQVKGVGFQQLWKNGGKEYYDGLTATNAVLTVQGTSSVNYRKGAANTDIDFNSSDAEGTPTLRSAGGDDLLATGLTNKGMKLTDTSIPITYSNMKVNFASCEQVNNMCNAAWYQNFQPYPSLSPRDCMEFVMGVQFIKDAGLNEPTVEDPTTHVQMLEVPLFSEKENRSANKYYMYSIGNLGNSKKNKNIFHSSNECCIEVTDNTTEGQRMISWPQNLDWSGDIENADHSYEVRYPKINDTIATGWQRFVEWMAASNPRAYTNETLQTPETYSIYTFRGHDREGTQVLRGTTITQYAGTYTTDSFERRMAKMLSECEDYMAMDSVVYHFCFIERHTMVDNVAKNTFWSAAKTTKQINGVDTEGYWIWDLSKNYDNDTSDGNNNEGQLVFDYGNEADDSISGKMVFNASDSVWFTFISNLKEACATMFINRESAVSNDGKYTGAWNSLLYHNYLLGEQQKVPERVWNECYRYSYLRPYERGINTSWISFLDGGQKTHQRRHYETFQELYLASKYKSPLSVNNNITLRGYTPQITPNMTEEEQSIITATLAAVPSKSEVTVTMYNKCYLTVHMGNHFLQQKVSKGVATTLTFRENNNYLTLNDTVINIDTASMIQEIGDLSPLYPGQSSFGAAYRLKSIKVGSDVEGYQNLNISATETGAFDFSTNTMLERLEIQNLKSVNAPLTLTNCAALKYLDASGSSFTGYTFADGGLLQTAKLGSPNTIVMRNLSYLINANFIIDDITKLRYVTIDNCPEIDTFSRALTYNNLLQLNLLNVNWRVQGIEFNSFVNHIADIPNYLITGKVELTPEMGTFSISNLGDTFTKDLKFYYYNINDPTAEPQPYHTVSFYGLYGEFIRNQYIPSGGTFNNNFTDYFTTTYLNGYNLYRDPSWVDGSDERYSFGSWDTNVNTIITSDLDIYAQSGKEYIMTYITQTASGVDESTHRYFAVGQEIERFKPNNFEKNYYLYVGNSDYWTTLENRVIDYFDSNSNVTLVDPQATKLAQPETWYAAYTRQPQSYSIKLYNTDINGDLAGTPLVTFNKYVITTGVTNDNKIIPSDIASYLPTVAGNKDTIYMAGAEGASDAGKLDENRTYRFLSVKPYIPTTGLAVTGEMNLYLTYYNKDDIFTNYFLNKITDCNLGDIAVIPQYSFNHNTNLEKLITSASTVGAYSFINFSSPLNPSDDSKKRFFVFKDINNFELKDYCFYYLNNAVVIFTGTGSFKVARNVFDYVQNCTIILLNTNSTITSNSPDSNFMSFRENSSNYIYVTDTAFDNYPTSQDNTTLVPWNLIDSTKSNIRKISVYKATIRRY